MNFKDDNQIELRIKHEQIGVVLKNYPFALTFVNAGGWLTALLFPQTWAFTLPVNGIYLLYSLFIINLIKKNWTPTIIHKDIDALSRKIFLTHLISGCILAVYSSWLIIFGSSDQLSITLLYFAIVVSMSVPYAATHLSSLIAYTFPMIIGIQLVSWLNMDDSKLLSFVTIGIPLFTVTLIYYGYTHNKSTRRHILVRLEKEQLSQRLSNEVEFIQHARQAAENAERVKTRFLAAASHDLRQPLQALHLFLDALDRQNLNQHQYSALHHIDLALSSLSQMLNSLLDFSRIESGTVSYHPKNLALQPALLNLMKLMGPLADQKNLVIRLRETNTIVYTDPILLELLLRNLISNAIRYTHKGGILLSARRRGRRVMVEVWDTGIGISQKELPTIFDEFIQLGNSERDWQNGLGLGLSIVQGISKIIGGQIEVKSKPGQGSVFRLWLPSANTSVNPTILPFVPVKFNEIIGLHILVVDDNSAVTKGMQSLLSLRGCVCYLASDGQSAESLLESNHIDVLITDYRLRNYETGGQVIGRLRRIQPLLPAIIITGDTDPALLNEANRLNARILNKPVRAAALVLAIQTQMHQATTMPLMTPS